MREVDRFQVQTKDGRTWWVLAMEADTYFQPLVGGLQRHPGSLSYELLDTDGGRYDISPAGPKFRILDLRPDAEDLEAVRI